MAFWTLRNGEGGGGEEDKARSRLRSRSPREKRNTSFLENSDRVHFFFFPPVAPRSTTAQKMIGSAPQLQAAPGVAYLCGDCGELEEEAREGISTAAAFFRRRLSSRTTFFSFMPLFRSALFLRSLRRWRLEIQGAGVVTLASRKIAMRSRFDLEKLQTIPATSSSLDAAWRPRFSLSPRFFFLLLPSPLGPPHPPTPSPKTNKQAKRTSSRLATSSAAASAATGSSTRSGPSASCSSRPGRRRRRRRERREARRRRRREKRSVS